MGTWLQLQLKVKEKFSEIMHTKEQQDVSMQISHGIKVQLVVELGICHHRNSFVNGLLSSQRFYLLGTHCQWFLSQFYCKLLSKDVCNGGNELGDCVFNNFRGTNFFYNWQVKNIMSVVGPNKNSQLNYCENYYAHSITFVFFLIHPSLKRKGKKY